MNLRWLIQILPWILPWLLLLLSSPSMAAVDLPAVTVTTEDDGSESYSISLQILAVMTLLTVLPSIVIMLTAFTRIIVVFAILRQAIGLQQTPSNQILVGIALFLTIFIMAPVLNDVHETALQPYLAETVSPQVALTTAMDSFRGFMLEQTREDDLALFMRLSEHEVVDDPREVNFFRSGTRFYDQRIEDGLPNWFHVVHSLSHY